MMIRQFSTALLLLWVWTTLTEAQAGREDSVEIDFDKTELEGQTDGTSYLPPIEQIFDNPAIASGLHSGAEAINRSLESLMDALFYSMLDNQLRYDINDHAWFAADINREVYGTPSGAFVVVDRVALGPRYIRELWRIHDIPVKLGVDGGVDVLQIYLRTDGMRIAEQRELPFWRRAVNNWFGILPLLSSVLPPSFNPNELYDPLQQLETPFIFPLDDAKFYTMPIGSIRSYSISGGATFAFDFGEIIDQKTKKTLDDFGGLKQVLPYTVFRKGEYRINVLRRDEHHAWVGVSEVDRTGHAISTYLGNDISVLKGALRASVGDWHWIWGGVPLAYFPMDVRFEQVLGRLFDKVYEYDLRQPDAVEAYKAAVRGDFDLSYRKYLESREKDHITGVTFHFTRLQSRRETNTTNGPNLAVVRQRRYKERSRAEIEIRDQNGKFHVLEAKQKTTDKFWDILVGEEERQFQDVVEIKVKRLLNGDEEGHTYVFSAEENPWRMMLSLSIQDRYVTTQEYDSYMDEIRYFTFLELDNVPSLPLRDPEKLLKYRRRNFMLQPDKRPVTLHVTPTFLGRFGAQAAISLSSKVIKKILDTSEDQMWRAFAIASEHDPDRWSDPKVRAGLVHNSQWFAALALYPLRLLNLRFRSLDSIKEAHYAIKGLKTVRDAQQPIAALEGFYEMLNADHPGLLTRALLLMVDDIEEVPRSVTFSVKPTGKSGDDVRETYGRLNGQTFAAGPEFPPPTRYSRSKKKLAAFFLDQPRESENKPQIQKLFVSTPEFPKSALQRSLGPKSVVDNVDQSPRHVHVRVRVKNVSAASSLKLYIRVEQAGKVQLGKLELAEDVIELTAIDRVEADTKAGAEAQAAKALEYEFYLTGPLSPLRNFIFDQAIALGGEFQVTMTASSDGSIWSDERVLMFKYEEGRLAPAEGT